MKKGLKIGAVILLVLAVFFGLMHVLSKQEEEVILDNYPYEPDTPAPQPHDGVFASDYGTMTFNGDGRTVILDVGSYFSSITGIPEGKQEAVYEFLTGELPPHGSMPIRYDVAHELRITIGEESYVLNLGIAAEDHQSATSGVGTVTEERIPIEYLDDYKFYSIIFTKQ